METKSTTDDNAKPGPENGQAPAAPGKYTTGQGMRATWLHWARNLAAAFIVVSIMQLLLPTGLFVAIGSQTPRVVPTGALTPWLVVLIVALVGYVITKRVMYDARSDGDLDARTQDLLLKVTVVICGASTLVPATWMAIYSGYIFTTEDSLLGWLLVILSAGAVFVAAMAAWKGTSTIYLFGYFTFHFVVFSIFVLLEPLWLVVVVPSLLAMNASVKVTSPGRRFVPRLKSGLAKGLVGVAAAALAVPLLTAFAFMPAYSRTYRLGPEHAVDELEVNFTWANATPLSPAAHDALVYMENKPNLHVSLTIPLIYGLKGDYGDKIAADGTPGVAWDVAVMVEEDFQTLEDTPIDEVDQLTYVDDGMVEQFCRNLTAAGIDVDFMPLLPKEKYFMYINDATIQRFLKTYAICREFINRTGLGTLHRGIVIDTERDYSNFDQVVANWWNEGLHARGRELLTDLVEDIKRDEYHWKTGTSLAEINQMSAAEFDAAWAVLVDNMTTHVSCATFQYHLDDFVDLDDEQQHFYEISILPPTTWDAVGVMTYDQGVNSEHNFYGYCRAIDYFFGDRGVPYLYSEDSEANILRKFQIAQNYGFEFVGMWALTSEYCYYQWNETNEWCGGFCDRFGWDALVRLADVLETPTTVEFEFDGSQWYKWTYMHALQLVDLYLVGPPVYEGWPIEGATRIRFPN